MLVINIERSKWSELALHTNISRILKEIVLDNNKRLKIHEILWNNQKFHALQVPKTSIMFKTPKECKEISQFFGLHLNRKFCVVVSYTFLYILYNLCVRVHMRELQKLNEKVRGHLKGNKVQYFFELFCPWLTLHVVKELGNSHWIWHLITPSSSSICCHHNTTQKKEEKNQLKKKVNSSIFRRWEHFFCCWIFFFEKSLMRIYLIYHNSHFCLILLFYPSI